MNPFEPDDESEHQVVRGLIQHEDFLKHFIELQIGVEIFEGRVSEYLRTIVRIVRDHYLSYQRKIQPGTLFNVYKREIKGSEDYSLLAQKMQAVLRDVLATPIRPSELKYVLDSLVETYRNYSILRQAKELERFFTCKFEHQKHDLCKNCPVWKDCRYLDGSEKLISEKIVFMQRTMQETMLSVTGAIEAEKGTAADVLPKVIEDYKRRKKIREESEEGFTFGVPTPWPTMTKNTDGWQATELYGIWAPKKTGKTTALLMCAAEASKAGHAVLVFAMEDSKQSWVSKLIAQQAGVDAMRFRHGMLTDSEELALFEETKTWQENWKSGKYGQIHEYHRRIGHIGLEDISRELEEHRSRGSNISLVIVDHIHVMRKPWKKDITRDDLRINHIVEQLKAFAQIFNCAVLAAAQLKTSGDRKGQARGSDQLEDCFDGVWHLYEYKGALFLKTSVSRNMGKFTIHLDDHRDRFYLPETTQMESDVTMDGGIDTDIPMEDWL